MCLIDMEWERIDDPISIENLTWRQLDGASRYLCFHYCAQVRRRAWKTGASQKAVFGLYDEHDKAYRDTPG